MRRWGGARVLYAGAAVVTLGATALFLGTRNYVCSNVDGAIDSTCGTLTTADLIVHAVVAVIGLGFGAYFTVRSVRAKSRR